MAVDLSKLVDLERLKEEQGIEHGMIATVESTSTASKAYAIGDRFYFKGKLCICTADIASGGTITLNTNCKLDVLGDDVSELKTAITLYEYVLGYKNLPSSALARGNVNSSGIPDGTNTAARVCTARPITFPTDIVLDFGKTYFYVYNTVTHAVLKSWSQGIIEIPANTSFAFVATLNVSSTEETSTEAIMADFSISCQANDYIDDGVNAYQSIIRLTDYNEFLKADNFVRGTSSVINAQTHPSIIMGNFNADSRISSKPMIAPFDLYIKYPYDIHIFMVKDGVSSASGWVTGEQIIPKETEFSLVLTPTKNTNTPATTEEILADLDVSTPFDFHNSNEWWGGLQTICRIGYNVENANTPPEMSIKSYKEAYLHGYRIMLCDCEWSSDHVPVALHDATINRVARNPDGTRLSETINPREATYAQLSGYDYGLYKGEKWKGTPLLTIENFVRFCKRVNCEFYLELRPSNLSTDNAKSLCDILKKLGMADRCTFIVESAQVIQALKAELTTFRAGIITSSTYTDANNLTRVTNAFAEKTDDIEVFTYYYSPEPNTDIIPQTLLDYCVTNNIHIEYTEIKSDAEFATFTNNTRAEYCTRIAAKPVPLLRKWFNQS